MAWRAGSKDRCVRNRIARDMLFKAALVEDKTRSPNDPRPVARDPFSARQAPVSPPQAHPQESELATRIVIAGVHFASTILRARIRVDQNSKKSRPKKAPQIADTVSPRIAPSVGIDESMHRSIPPKRSQRAVSLRISTPRRQAQVSAFGHSILKRARCENERSLIKEDEAICFQGCWICRGGGMCWPLWR